MIDVEIEKKVREEAIDIPHEMIVNTLIACAKRDPELLSKLIDSASNEKEKKFVGTIMAVIIMDIIESIEKSANKQGGTK